MRKAIIIDDELASRRLISHLLTDLDESLGISIAGEAADGIEALNLFEEIHPDIVFMDISMPFKDGIEVLKEMKKRQKLVKVVMVTGHNEFNYARESLNYGASYLLSKPIVEQELITSIKKVIDEMEYDLERKANSYEVLAFKPEEIKLDFKERDFVSACVVCNHELSSKGMLQSLGNISVAIAKEYGILCYPYIEDEKLILVLGVQIGNMETLDAMLMDLGHAVSNYTNGVAKIGVGNKITRIDAIHKSISKAIESVSKDTSEYSEPVINYLDLEENEIPQNRKIRKAKDYIDQNYKNSLISMQDTANEVNLSPAYFCNLFKIQTGIRFNEYLANVRIEKAKELLRDHKCMVYEVAEMVGFVDSKYFSSKFKSKVGCTPSEYRNRY